MTNTNRTRVVMTRSAVRGAFIQCGITPPSKTAIKAAEKSGAWCITRGGLTVHWEPPAEKSTATHGWVRARNTPDMDVFCETAGPGYHRCPAMIQDNVLRVWNHTAGHYTTCHDYTMEQFRPIKY